MSDSNKPPGEREQASIAGAITAEALERFGPEEYQFAIAPIRPREPGKDHP